jgi:hypothetical protein
MSLFFGLLRQSLIAARDGKRAAEIPPETVARSLKLAADARTDMLNQNSSVERLGSVENKIAARAIPHPNPSPIGRGVFHPSPSGRRAGDEGIRALYRGQLSFPG